MFDWSFYRQGTNTAGSSDTFFADALKVFGDPDPTAGSPWDKGERLAKLVRENRTLLVLDGIEPMQYGPGEQEGQFKDPALQTLVKELASNNNGFLVITSRLRLRDLDGLSGAKVQTKALEHLSADAGAQLLRARGVKGTDEDLRSAANEYQGHGLALTLLGSYLEDVAEGDIRRRNEIGPLHYDERLGGHARCVLEAYEPWLGKTERAILRMVGLFDRPASEEEIGALRAEPVVPGLNDALVGVSGRDWNKALAKLRRIRLIAVDSGTAIDAHPLVRQHFGEPLKRDNMEAWREGHRRLYEFLQTKAPDLPNTLAEMEPLYAAVVHGCLAGKNQEALDEVWRKRMRRQDEHFSIHKLGAFGSEIATLSAFFDPPWEHLAPGLSEPDQVIVLASAAFTLRALGRLQEAAGLFRLALKRRIAQENWKNAAVNASNLSQLLQSRGELREAIETARTSVELADKSGDAAERIDNRTTLAAAQHAMGQCEEAATLFVEAERIQKERQPEYPLLSSLQGFYYCDLLLDQGRAADVRERANPRPEVATRKQSLLGTALDRLSLGRAHLVGIQHGTSGDLDVATSHIKQAVDGLRRAGHQDDLPLGLLARAALHIHTRVFADARSDLDEAYALATHCGFRLHEADAHLGYARLAIAERQATAAREHLEKARRIVDATGYHRRDEEIAQLQQDLDKLPPEIKPVIHSTQPIVSPSPIMTNKTAERVDLGIVIALQEEFRELHDMCGPFTQHKNEKLTSYRFKHGEYQIVAAFVGDMGQSQAGRVADRLIDAWHPESIVSMGIAGGIHDDLRVGDVYVPRQAVEYIQDAKVIPKPNAPSEFTLVPGGPARDADFALIEAVRNIEFGHAEIYSRFVAACAQDFEQLLPNESKRKRLIIKDLVRPTVGVLADGHVATGPVVGAAEAFTKWIHGHARNVKALEMETAAVFMSAQQHSNVTRAFAIRGISDYGDDRKAALDKVGEGALRRYAMRNAVRFLWALLDAKVLPLNPP